MAIQLPTVKRADPVAPASEGRLNVNLPDASRAQAQIGGQLEDLAAKGVKFLDDAERADADNISLQVSSKFQRDLEARLEGGTTVDESGQPTKNPGIKNLEGDPTESYQEFDEYAKTELERLSAGNPGWSDMTKRAVVRRLSQTYNAIGMKRDAHEGSQYARFEKKVTDDKAKLLQKDLMDATMFLDPADPASFALYDKKNGEIIDLRVRQGLKNGAVTIDPNGKHVHVDDDGTQVRVNINDSIKYQIAQDLSEANTPAIENMIATGRLDIAKEMLKKYGDNIEPTKIEKLNEQFKKKDQQLQALSITDAIQGMEINKRKEEIKKIEDLEVKQKVKELIDAGDRHKENEIRRASTENFNFVAKHVGNMQRSGEGYANSAELDADDQISPYLNKITDAKQREAIYKMLDSNTRKESTLDAETAMWNVISDVSAIRQLTPAKIIEMKADLSNKHRSLFENAIVQATRDTDSQERSRYADTNKIIYQQMVAQKVIDVDKAGKPKSKKDQEALNTMRTRYAEQFDSIGPGTKQEITEQVKADIAQFAAEKQKERESSLVYQIRQRFGWGTRVDPKKELAVPISPARTKKKPDAPVTPSGSVPVTSGYSTLSASEKQALNAEFMSINKRSATLDEIKDFYNKKAK